MPIVAPVKRAISYNPIPPAPTADEMPLDSWMYDPDTAIINTHKYGVYIAITVEDFPLLRQAFDDGWKWNVYYSRGSRQWRVGLWRGQQSSREHLSLGKVFLGGTFPEYDHVNRQPLDNRRPNLRGCTRSQNNANRHLRSGASEYRGVSWYKQIGKWYATCCINGTSIHLGTFTDEIDAAKAYDRAALKAFGEFANLNFPTEES